MNWADRIALARDTGSFTDDDCTLAHDWVTCACGEQDPRIPRDNVERHPHDTEIADYGFDFCNAVENNRPDDAAEILGKIETRATQILTDLGYKS